METLIRGDTLKRPSDLLDELKSVKDSYHESTKDLTFRDKELILTKETERLAIKGLENLWRISKDSSNLAGRQLEEKVIYLEEQLKNKKEEISEIENENSSKVDKIQAEYQDVMLKYEINKNKTESANLEKNKVEEKFSTKIKELMSL